MKKLFIASFMMFFSFASAFASENSELKQLKTQQKVLKLNTELNKLKTQYEKTLEDITEWQKRAMDANANANITSPTYSTTDASGTAKEAKERVKTLKKVQKWNSKLSAGRKKADKLEKQINKTQHKLDKLTKGIRFINQ